MKYLGVLVLILLLAIASLFVGLQMGKGQLNQAEESQSNQLSKTPTSEGVTSLPSELAIESSHLVSELKQEVLQLKQQLAEKNSLIDAMNSSMGLLEQQVELAYSEIDQVTEQTHDSPFHPEPDSITTDQANQWVPENFANAIASQQGDMVALFKRHHQADINQEWATEREQALKDSFALSEYADMVNITSVNCKTSTCEVRGEELEPNGWMLVSQRLQETSLSKNASTWTYLIGNEEGETLIHMLSEVDDSTVENQ